MKRIWLDAGHGGKDPGAVGNGLVEKELVLKMQTYMIAYLKANYEDFCVEATRTTDVFETLSGRARRANAWGADVFISLHINAGGGTGFESFIYTNASSGSCTLQDIVNQEALSVAKKYGLGAHGGVANKRGNLYVVRETNMPAILMETAYIDSKDVELLKKEQFLRDMAAAYARGLAEFLDLKPKTQVQGEVSRKTESFVDNQPPQYFYLETGEFSTEQQAAAMKKMLEDKYKWIVHQNGKKLQTGTWEDAAVAQKYKTELKQAYKWWVYIRES
jgi:N-acetylmuramoyl-L-alanine amidase